MRKSSKELKAKRIQIKFSGEQGIDFGGLTKEWLELVMQEALKPDQGLFVYSSDKRNSLHPFKNSKIDPDHLSFFRFIGRMLAKIIIEGFNISIHFDKSVYKYLLGLKCTLQDLEEIDPQFYNSLMWIKNNKIENILNLTFSVENNNFGSDEVIDLIPEGRQVLVTDDNKNDYIDLVVENRLIKSDNICIFNEKELELLICGIPDINIDDWKNNTEYIGYTSHSRNISWFWKAVEGFTPEEKAKLLQFCTGSSHYPLKIRENTKLYFHYTRSKIEFRIMNTVDSKKIYASKKRSNDLLLLLDINIDTVEIVGFTTSLYTFEGPLDFYIDHTDSLPLYNHLGNIILDRTVTDLLDVSQVVLYKFPPFTPPIVNYYEKSPKILSYKKNPVVHDIEINTIRVYFTDDVPDNQIYNNLVNENGLILQNFINNLFSPVLKINIIVQLFV
ncbi:hypothetical protein G9O61_00g012270 [Vairimorpha ceranae]|nr:hypothetical protein G9O61_00g012270 [Vairimorpha ceranae]